MDIKDYFEKISSDTKEYLKKETEYVKLEIIEEGSRAIGAVFSFIAILLSIALFFLLLGFCLGFYLTDITGSYIQGFGYATLIFLVLTILLIKFRRILLERPLMSIAVNHIFKNIYEKQKNKEQ